MNKMSITLAVFLVVFADLNNACDQFRQDNCTADRKFEISEAGPDIPTICRAEGRYISCLSSIGCHDNATYVQMAELCSDGGSMLTASILKLALLFIVVLIQ